jgi:hypothetical protein
MAQISAMALPATTHISVKWKYSENQLFPLELQKLTLGISGL